MTALAKGIRLDLAGKLTERERQALLRFMARMSEASYRRGLQQGKTFADKGAFTADPYVLRFKRSLDASPWGENAKRSPWTARGRLWMEYRDSLNAVGLGAPVCKYCGGEGCCACDD